MYRYLGMYKPLILSFLSHGRATFNIHTSGATPQRLVSVIKPIDLALAPFSIFVIVRRWRVVVRAMLAAVIELSLPYVELGIRVSWDAFFGESGFDSGFFVCT
ncbi:unnamed protein product [Penicillium nalgiovense]|nr:unnamed protein product [Penicillium nalgiovense]